MHLFALNRGSVQTVFSSVGSAGEVDLCEVDLWGSLSTSTSGAVCPQMGTNYPRGHFLPEVTSSVSQYFDYSLMIIRLPICYADCEDQCVYL